MRGTVMYAAGDVRIENVPDPTIQEPTDAVIRVTRACICGSDLWPYKTLQPDDGARVMGHEAIGVVEEIGADVRTLKIGDVVVMPFAFSDGTCIFCDEGLQTECVHGGFFGNPDVPGAQPSFFKNITIGGGPAPVRAYIDDLLPDVLEGRIEPGRVFDRTVDLDGVPDGYRAMNDRESIKVLVRP